MRVVFAGTPEVAVPALDAIAASRHELVGVVTRPDAPSGRGRKLVASPVAQRAEELGVPVLKPEHPRDPDFQAALAELRPDACPVVAYGALLPQSALDLVPHGWINLHFSVLPSWRGAAPVQHSLWAGDEVTGATTFRIVKALDAGPVFGVMTERIRPDDTAGDLLGAARRGRRGPAGADPRRDRGRHARGARAAGRTASRSRPRSSSTTPASTGATPRSRSTGRCAPAPGARRVEHLRGRADQDRPAAPGRPRGRWRPASSRSPRTPSSSAPPPRPSSSARSRRSARSRWRAADWARGVRLESGVRLGD